MNNTPDVWHVIKIQHPAYPVVYKLLWGNYGGYSGADTWNLNSGITRCEYDDNFWYFYGYSGSCYKCAMSSERFSGFTSTIFSSLKAKIEKAGGTCEVITAYEG